MFVLWTLTENDPKRWKIIIAAVTGCLLLPCLHHAIIVTKFHPDHLYYVTINIAQRRVATSGQLLRRLIVEALSLYYLGPFLCLCSAAGVFLFIVRRVRGMDLATKLALLWIVSGLAITSTVRYFPPRYCFSFLVPVTIVAVKCASIGAGKSKLIGATMYALLVFALVSNVSEIIAYMAKPSYSVAAFAEAVRTAGSQDLAKPCVFMGNFANTVSLFNSLPSENDNLGTATIAQRIGQCDPHTYLKLGPASLDDEEQFLRAGKTLEFESKADVLNDYTGLPTYLYRVVPRPPRK